jgi:hypothetical protein
MPSTPKPKNPAPSSPIGIGSGKARSRSVAGGHLFIISKPTPVTVESTAISWA